MSETDLIQACFNWVTLAYTASQWWITVTTALVVGTYIGARHIPDWLFGLITVLYLCTAISVMFEMWEYSELALSYGFRMTQMRIANHEFGSNTEPAFIFRFLNGWTNYAIIALGTVGAMSFSFIHWRHERAA
ncbi:MAG TPA: hypothetical protein VL971_04705 [Rhizomicrobium sp.]|nr:hypothetical protein [Rhizomicrobium sp.]